MYLNVNKKMLDEKMPVEGKRLGAGGGEDAVNKPQLRVPEGKEEIGSGTGGATWRVPSSFIRWEGGEEGCRYVCTSGDRKSTWFLSHSFCFFVK